MAAQYTPPTTAEVNALFGSSCYVCGKCNAGKLCARPGCGHRLEHGKIYGQGRFCHRNKCTEAAGVTKCKRCKHFLSMPVGQGDADATAIRVHEASGPATSTDGC